jgi:hypothetical protein
MGSAAPRRLPGMAAPQEPRAVVELVQGERTLLLGPLPASPRGDLAVLDDLLRLSVGAARLGWRVRISEVREELRELFDLMGLTDRVCDGPPDQPAA